MKFGKLFAMVLLSLVLAACGGGGDDNEGGNTSESGGGGGGSTLAQTITSSTFEGGMLTVGYPEGWAAQEAGGSVTIASSQELLASADALQNAPEEGTVGQVIFLGTAETAGLEAFGLSADASLVDILNTFSQNFVNSGAAEVEMGEAEEFDAGGKPAAIVTGTGSQDGQAADVVLAIVNEGDGFVLITFASAEGQIGDYNDEVRAIAGSINYETSSTEPEATAAG